MFRKKILRTVTTTSLLVMTVLFQQPATLVQANADVAFNQSVDRPQWHNDRSAQWVKDEDTQYASDHILVKRVGQDVERVAVPEGMTVATAVSQWQNDGQVEYAEPDHLYRALGQETSWGWTTVKASEAATTNSVTGSGIVVAVVDTGVDYDHEDLDANNWVNTGETASNNIDDDGNGYVDDYYGYDFIGSFYTAVTPDADPQDEAGHGTHVAGIIAAENNTVGVRGVAPSAQIMPVKVLDSVGYGFDSTVADGIRYAVDEGADVINLSLGSSVASNTIKSAVDYAETNGVLVVAASGNSANFSAPSYPAAYSNVISVGATNEEGYKTEYSNWGKIDVMAPGDEILSSIPGNQYATYSGTSMASPHVAGVVALAMQKFATTDPKIIRHVVETTADDFSVMTGPDYVSGYGMVNALDATSTQANSVFLFADEGYVISDSSSDAVVTVSLRNASRQPIANETIVWTTTRGTLSTATGVTDGNGRASVTLTADDTYGLATVTADPVNYDANTIQLAVLSDIPRAETVGVSPYGTTSSTDGELVLGGCDGCEDSDTGDELPGQTELSNNYYQAGDQLTIWAHPTGFDRQMHDVTMTYSVTDPDGNAVDGLSGTTPESELGLAYYIWYFPQTTIQTTPLTLPDDATSGQYTVNITLTDVDTSETSTTATSFWVGELPEILVIDNDYYCYDTPVEGLDFGYMAYCPSAGQKVVDALADAGYDSLLWNTTMHGTPTAEDLAFFPMVVDVDSTFAYLDSSVLQSYLDAGGNLLITSEEYAYTDSYWTGQPSDFMWNYLHAGYASTISQPDVVTGATGTEFQGNTYNINTFDLEGNGTHAAYASDELLLNAEDGTAEAIFNHAQGKSTDKVAGIRVDAENYRAVLLTFGLETINDIGTATKANVLGDLTSWLLGADSKITKVTPKSISNSRDRKITITGTHFQLTGTTTVTLGRNTLSNVVVHSATKITATVPAGLDPKKYDVTITRPDGEEVTKADAVRVTKGGPTILSITPGYASNDRVREISIIGNKFNKTSKVFFGKQRMTDVTFNDRTMLTVKIPKDFTAGQYAVMVKTGHGNKIKQKGGMTVRVGFTQELSNGSEDDQVLALERRLKKYGYFEDKANTVFDSSTEEALARYQHDQGITASGVTDGLTRYYLNTNE